MISMRVLDNGETVEFVMKGAGTADEVIDVIKTNYPSISGGVLWNFLEGDISSFTGDDMICVASVAKTASVHKKTAFLGESDVVFGMLRMYQANSEVTGVDLNMSVFRGRDEALEWLKT